MDFKIVRVVILLCLLSSLPSPALSKNMELNSWGFQDAMFERYDLAEDFKKEFTQKTENGTMKLVLYKTKETTLDNDV